MSSTAMYSSCKKFYFAGVGGGGEGGQKIGHSVAG